MSNKQLRFTHQYHTGESTTDDYEDEIPLRQRTVSSASDTRSLHSVHSIQSHSSTASFPAPQYNTMHGSTSTAAHQHPQYSQHPHYKGQVHSRHQHHQQHPGYPNMASLPPQHQHHPQQNNAYDTVSTHSSQSLHSQHSLSTAPYPIPQQQQRPRTHSQSHTHHRRTASDTSGISMSVSLHSYSSESTHDQPAFLFVSPAPSNLICSICHRVFTNPVIAGCGHTFCSLCVQRSPASQVCPLHMSVLSKTHLIPNLSVAEQIQNLMVHCPNGVMKVDGQLALDPNGCQDTITVSQVTQHKAACPFTKVACPNSNRCGPVQRQDLNLHLQQCQHHRCDYSAFGCKFTGSAADVAHHAKSCSLAHKEHPPLSLTAGISAGLDTIKQLQAQLSQRDADVQALQATVQQLVARAEERDSSLQASNALTQQLQHDVNSLSRTVAENKREISSLNAQLASITAIEGTSARTTLYKCQGTLVGHQKSLWALASHNDLLFSASSDEAIKVWDTSTDFRCKRTLTQHRDKVLCLTVAGRRLYSGSEDRTICVWDVDKLELVDTLAGHDDPVCALVVVNNILYSGSNKCVHMWNTQTLEKMGTLKGFNHWVRALVEHDSLIFAGSYQTVSVWSAGEPDRNVAAERKRVLQTSGGSVYSLFVSDHFVIAGTYEAPIHIWHRDTFEKAKVLEGHTGAIFGLTVLPDRGKGRLFSASYDKTVRVWCLETFTELQVLERHQQSVTCVTVLKGKIFTGAADNTVKVWQ